jgi:hypothetical protein
MYSVLRCLGLLAAFALLLPALTAADTKTEKKEKLIPAGELVGKVKKVDGGGHRITLEVTQAEPVRSGKTITARPKHVNVDLETVDEPHVRLEKAPVTVDANGKNRRMNAKELQAFKDRSGLPGYKGDITDLKPNQTVRVQLGKPRTAKADEKGKIMTIFIQDEVVK